MGCLWRSGVTIQPQSVIQMVSIYCFILVQAMKHRRPDSCITVHLQRDLGCLRRHRLGMRSGNQSEASAKVVVIDSDTGKIQLCGLTDVAISTFFIMSIVCCHIWMTKNVTLDTLSQLMVSIGHLVRLNPLVALCSSLMAHQQHFPLARGHRSFLLLVTARPQSASWVV